MSSYSHPFRALGVVPAAPRIAGFAAHAFVHVGWMQLLGAVLLLLLAGPLLEPLWGRGAFAALIAVSALASAGVFFLVHAGADRALLGAGGAVSGVVAAALVRFAREEVDLLRWLSPLKSVELIAPGWILALLWIGYEAAMKFAVPGAFPDGIDTVVGYTAHAAGALSGGAFAFGAIRLELEGPRLGHSPPPVVERARESKHFDLQEVSRARARETGRRLRDVARGVAPQRAQPRRGDHPLGDGDRAGRGGSGAGAGDAPARERRDTTRRRRRRRLALARADPAPSPKPASRSCPRCSS